MLKPVQKESLIKPYIPRIFRHMGVQLVLIYLIVFIFISILSVPFSRQHAQSVSQQALTRVDQYFDQIINDLDYLLLDENQNLSCEELLVPLRRGVFQSDRVKEIGVFNDKGRIFCTSNNGTISFYLYRTMLERIKNSPYHRTLSYTTTKLAKEKSIILMFRDGGQGNGISVLIPPRYVLLLIDEFLSRHHLDYDIKVITRSLQEQSLPGSTRIAVSSSAEYPLVIELYKQDHYLLYYMLSNSWIGLLIAGLVCALFALQRNKKLSSNALPISLESALQCGHLEPYYQPIINQKEGHIVGGEALLRWNDPVQGMISPEIFIPLAEKVGLIEEITHYVIEQVCLYLDSHRECFSDRYISVNISRSVILRDSFINNVVSVFRSRPELASRIVFEITENNDFTEQDLDVLRRQLAVVTGLGIRLAVDDFGTGYSGLNFIRQCEFDFLKIDRVFVKNLYEESNLIPVLKSMQRLAEDLNIAVIVEGVEESEQLKILNSLGFTYIQGFYFSRPLPGDEFSQLF
ncbi:EAL domain-containing protein [Vibrio sp. HA2012]|uniref:EAL domain-containing protein n=1 Tax=Vibrio sp. HA2012 TaxID=1971595 RepID=UPI000C2C82F0|nr:EAL domain-containing protein [Vibrio sp. HA2012]PJC88207.1 EAL domain-containing protein [Vibrio sp. HA2012]